MLEEVLVRGSRVQVPVIIDLVLEEVTAEGGDLPELFSSVGSSCHSRGYRGTGGDLRGSSGA